MDEISIDGGQILLPTVEGIHELLAHAHQCGGAGRREIKPAKQLLSSWLRSGMDFGGGCVRGIRLPGGNRLLHARGIRAETLGQRFEKSDARTRRERGIAAENFARERNAGRFTATGQQVFAQFDKTFGTRRRLATPVAGQ